jgi:hypothetical protein
MVRKSDGFFKHIYDYMLIHERIRWRLRAVPHAVVHYEELVLDLERTLSSVLEPLGLRFDSRQLLSSEHVQHTLGGNKFRWQPNGLFSTRDGGEVSVSPSNSPLNSARHTHGTPQTDARALTPWNYTASACTQHRIPAFCRRKSMPSAVMPTRACITPLRRGPPIGDGDLRRSKSSAASPSTADCITMRTTEPSRQWPADVQP